MAVGVSIFLLQAAAPCRAQAAPDQNGAGVLDGNGPDSGAPPDSGGEPAAVTGGTQSSASGQAASAGASAATGDWHADLLIYLWFPGMHGTVGSSGYTASVHASPADLLSNFRFGLMGTADFRYKRLVVPVDMMWVRLGDEKAAPPNESGVTSGDVKVNEFLLTPYVGYRGIDQEKVKFDVLGGIRYWHLGQDLRISTTGETLSFSDSQNWADALIGGRILLALTPKVNLTMAGDVGGGGSQLDYQAVGMLGYRIKPKWTLQFGYRYLSVNHRSGGVIFNTISSGIGVGLTVELR